MERKTVLINVVLSERRSYTREGERERERESRTERQLEPAASRRRFIYTWDGSLQGHSLVHDLIRK